MSTSTGERGKLSEQLGYDEWVAAVVEAVETRRPSSAEGQRSRPPARGRSRKVSGLFVRLHPSLWAARTRS